MVVPSVIRVADWMLSADTSGSGPISEIECTTCGESSIEEQEAPAAEMDPHEEDALEVWCLRHATRTGHTGFRRIVTSFVRASLNEAIR